VVTWTFNDGNGNTSTATQTVVIKGLTFDGFYSPINGVGGSYASPVLKGIARGCTVPVKFESECEGGHYRTAVPTVPTLSLLKYTSATAFQAVTGGKFTRVSTQSEDDWHFDWNTSGLSSGVYKIVATMQDGTSQYVFVSLK